MTIRWPTFLFFFLACALAAVAPAHGASSYAQPRIEAFYVNPANQLTPGTELVFRVEGTPYAKASVRISGVARNIPLKEVEPGIYESTYTVQRNDRIAADRTAHATLRARGRSAVANLNFEAPRFAAARVAAPRIQRFTMVPLERLEPGAELRFTLIGTPGGRAFVTIEGVARDIPMHEVKSGHYEGSYTIRNVDDFAAGANAFASLEAAGRAVREWLNQPLLADVKAPLVTELLPRKGEQVAAGPVTVRATFDDSGGVGVDPKSVKVVIDGRDVTHRSSITPQYFTHRAADLGPGSHQVTVTARDTAGNAVRHAWSFTVGQQASALPLQISSHENNAVVEAGPIEVRGRTAPGAEVDVQVDAVASVGGLFGVTQQILSRSIRADADGKFAFSFQSPLPVPGTRYEISLNARTAQASKDMELVLLQQK